MKDIDKLHVITDNLTVIENACSAGCNWIQLRIKDKPIEEIETAALSTWEICNSYGATFILNDHVELTQKVKADGVHLGKTDMHPAKARKLLGNDIIIGGTANTLEDIEAIQEHVDYIGLGPFRFTETKENLSPVLGLEAYHTIKSTKPIIAIGGIKKEDVNSLLKTGIHGVAVSSAIAKADDVQLATQEFLKKLNYGTVSYC